MVKFYAGKRNLTRDLMMKCFNYDFLSDAIYSASVLNMTSKISELRALSDIRQEKFKTVYTELEKVAKVQSVKSSNAIEGIITTDERIVAIVNRTTEPKDHSELEIAGYRDALNEIHQNYSNMDFSINTMLMLHQIMMKYADPQNAGQLKKTDNIILEISKDGLKKVRFKPTPAKETKMALEQLVLAYNDASSDTSINDLVLIPCVILDFLCIHPFADGNGRISRLLTLLMLYKCGYSVSRYISLEEQVNKQRSFYYETLRVCSEGWNENCNTYLPFIEFSLSMVMMCYRELDMRFATVNSQKVNKTTRVEACVLNSLTPISKANIKQFLPDVSVTTIEKVLGDMMKSNKIKKVGTGRGTKYIKI